jgi:hypothetical protein
MRTDTVPMSSTQTVVVYRRFVSRTWAAVFFGLTTLDLFGRGPEPWIRLMCRSVFVRPRTGTLDPAYVYECLRSAEDRNPGSGLCVWMAECVGDAIDRPHSPHVR